MNTRYSKLTRCFVAIFILLNAAIHLYATPINIDIVPLHQETQENGWNRMSVNSTDWGIGHPYTPWPTNLVDATGAATAIKYQVIQRSTSMNSNNFSGVNALTGEALDLFGTPEAGNAADLAARTGNGGYITLQFLDLDPNMTYKFSIFSGATAGSIVTNNIYLEYGRTNVVSYMGHLPTLNLSNVVTLTASPRHVTSQYAGELGNIETDLISFRIEGQAPNVAYLNAIIIEPISGVQNPDSDMDGILDDWETSFFGDLTTANATSDYDMDGLSDYSEYIAGTVPTNSASALLTKIEGGQEATITWEPVTGRVYSVWYTSSPDAPYADCLASNLVHPQNSVLDDQHPDAEALFYRIEVDLP